MVSDGTTLKTALELAEKILKKPPIPVTMTKQAITSITTSLDKTGTYMDEDQFVLTTYTKDHKEGLAAFLDKRNPRFKGE